MSSSLAGVRVLDFSRILAGPFTTMQLADLGAEVTKIERPGSGDDTRQWGPPWDEHGEATYFQAVNRNKASVVLDLGTAAGRAEARRLALDTDVIVENFRPGLMASFGLDHDQLSEENPGLVYCSISGFGRGLGAHLPGYDLLIQAVGGLMSITGPPEQEPQKVGVAVVDVLAGMFATTGILAALHHRHRSGRGQRVDVNLLSSLLAGLANQASGYTSAGVVPGRLGNRHPSIAPYELFPTGEGTLVLAVGNDRQFRALCAVLGAPRLSDDARFVDNPARVRFRDQLRSELVVLLAARSAADWSDALAAARVPAGVVNDLAGAFRLAQRLGLDPIVEVPREGGGAVRLTRSPIDLSVTPVTYRSAPPSLAVSPVPRTPAE